jgi:serine/threonine-protein kinase
MRVSATGGTPQPFTRLVSSKNDITHRWPQVLPGAKAVVYAIGIEFNSATIAVASLKSGAAKTLAIRGGYPRYITEGYLVFERQEGLYAVAFDLERLEVTGSPFLVLQVQAAPQSGAAGFAVSETGSLVYTPPVETIAKLAWVNRKGVLEPLEAPGRDYLGLRLSPDGKRVVMPIREKGFADIWMYDIQRGTLTRLTFGVGDNFSPVFSPDGQRIAFLRLKDANFSILAKPADGSGSEETLLPPQGVRSSPSSWSPDGKFLACGRRSTGLGEIWVLPLEGERKPQLVLANQFDNNGPKFSPDGRFLDYVSNENGRNEVYVIPFRNGSGKWQISTGGGNGAVWERDGKELFYSESGNIMGVDIATQPTFHASTPRVIVPAKAMGNLPGFDVSPDGQRFLVLQQNSEAAQTGQINVVLNWSEELRRRSASGTD